MLEIKNLNYAVKGRPLLDNLNITFGAQRLIAIMGPNGAGKSTLLKTIAGDYKPDSGTITWFGKPLSDWTPAALAKIRSVLSQQYNLTLPFTVREIIEMGRYPHCKNQLTPHCSEVIEAVTGYVGIAGYMDRNYLTLSGGEQQRVQLARVLTQVWDKQETPGFILLDEPVSALDIRYQHQLLALVQALTRRGFTVVAVLHDLNLAMQYADDVLLLKKGRVVACGVKDKVMTPEKIHEAYDVNVNIHKGYGHEGSPYITVNRVNNNFIHL